MSIQILNLNPCYDHWVIIQKPPRTPNVLRGEYVVKLVDGKGLNIARVFKTLGFEDYTCINILGGEVGKIIHEKCQEDGIKTLEFWIKDENRINTAVVYEYEKRMLMINEPGPMMQRDEIERFVEFFSSVLQKNSTLVISGSAPRGFGTNDMSKIAQIAKENSCRLMIDISGEWLKELMNFEPEMVKVNADELRIALDLQELSVKELCKIKNDYNIKILCVTYGKQGAVTVTDSKIVRVKPKVVHSDYSVGSGDSFFAGYLYSEALNKPIQERLIFATACGTANTLRYGAAIFSLQDLEGQLSNVKITEEEL
ncbi:MAG: PfkB family carbohydrate kinase [Pseudothermotoga sp.]